MDETQSSTDNKVGMDWKKKGFVPAERLSLRIDAQEANRYQAKNGKAKLGELSPALKSLRKKVRNPFDEEEDDNDGSMDDDTLRMLRELEVNASDASNNDTSLLNAVSSAERHFISQRSTIENNRMEENAGKLNAMQQADTVSRKAGITKMTTQEYTDKMQEAIYNPQRLRREAFEENVAKKVGLKGHVTKHNTGKVVKGVRKITETTKNKKVKDVKMDDAAQIGKKNLSKNATAELILKKSGQTARLTEIKMKTSYNIKTPEQKKSKKSYSAEMKELLRKSLQKNGDVR